VARKVLFDVDIGRDDAIMLLTALADDGIDVVGVSTVFGNTSLENTTWNTVSLLEYVGSKTYRSRKVVHDYSTRSKLNPRRMISITSTERLA